MRYPTTVKLAVREVCVVPFRRRTPMPVVLQRGHLSVARLPRLVAEDHAVCSVLVERGVEVHEIDGFICDEPLENFEVVAVDQRVYEVGRTHGREHSRVLTW